jgi:NADH-quinone oxidoreductase subunit G
MTENNTVNLTIDEVEVSVPKGTLIVDAAKRIGNDIPVFCYHPKLDPAGLCRMCLVEVGAPRPNRETGEMELAWYPTLQTACTMPVTDGMVVRTVTDKVREARDDILEFLLSSHPLDCPVCDKGGECPLQNLTLQHGPGTSRMNFDSKISLDKHVPLGELIYLDRERCIQCARCTRFCDEIAGDHVLGFDYRSREMQIVSYSEPGFDSYFSGNTTDICPVGALTTADFRFGARPWEMIQVATICPHCPVGCNMTFSTRLDRDSGGRQAIKRVMPRQNEQVNEIWICDKGRFGHHHAGSPERLTRPMIREGGELVEKDWPEVIATLVAKLKAVNGDVAGLAGSRLSNEDLYAFQKLIRGMGSNHLNIYPAYLDCGDLVAQAGVGLGTNFGEMGSGDVVIVAASDLEEEAPIWWMRVKQAADRGATLVVVGGRPTKLDRYAAHVLRTAYGEETAALYALLAAAIDKSRTGRQVDGLDDLLGKLGNFKADDVQQAAVDAISGAGNLVAIVGNEALSHEAGRALAQAAANLLIATGHVGRPNNGLLVVWAGANIQGALDMGVSPNWGPGYQPADMPGLDTIGTLNAVKSQSIKALYIAGADPAGDEPAAVEALNAAEFVVVQDMFLTETAMLADIVLPVQSFAEREGTYTNGERRVQRFYPAIPVMGHSRADWDIFREVAFELGQEELVPAAPAAILLEIVQNVAQYAGITYQELAKVEPQWPDVGGTDLYYGGNAFQNTRGLGIQWPTLADDPDATLSVAWAEPVAAPTPSGDELLVVPINLLYDRETIFAKSEIVHQRVPLPYVTLHPADAERLGIASGDGIALKVNGSDVQVMAYVAEEGSVGSAPQGVALLPMNLQSGGAPSQAVTATLRKVAEVAGQSA